MIAGYTGFAQLFELRKNIEAYPSHTYADKFVTIKNAQAAGLRVLQRWYFTTKIPPLPPPLQAAFDGNYEYSKLLPAVSRLE